MQCHRVHRARRRVQCAAALIVLGGGARAARAQSYPSYPPPSYPGYPTTPTPPPYPGVPTSTTTTLPLYHPPVITLAQPAEGVVLPDDKPIAVLRFAALETVDPIDALSLSVTVDGEDRTALFTLTQGEAWGRLSAAGELLAAGQHEVRARICSARGTCGTTKATVTVVAGASLLQQLTASGPTTSKQPTASRTSRVFGAVLQAVRVLIK